MSPLVRRGVRDQRRAPLIWGGSLGLMCALIVAIYPSIEDSIGKAVEQYPEGLREAFNIGTLNTVEAYLDAEMFSLIVPLAVALLAERVITRGLSGAQERGYLDTLLAVPLSRRALVAGTFVTAALTVAAVLVVTGVLTLAAGAMVGAGLDVGLLAAGVANVWPLAIFFAGVAALACGVFHHAGPVTPVAAGILVAMYVLDLAGKLDESIEGVRYLSAFKYYGSALQDGIDPLAFAGLTLAGLLLAAAGTLLFERRDVL